MYAMHPLVHAWGRDKLALNERKECCLMAYIILSCSLRFNAGQAYEFWRTLVTHMRANLEHIKSEVDQNIVSYMDDAYEKFGMLLSEQCYSKEAETLQMKVLDERNKNLGVEHPNTLDALGNLAGTYQSLGRYTESEKLGIQVLDSRKGIFGGEHPDIVSAMANLAVTY